ncbi:MAG: CARDB domain-containing protein, partial [Microcystaceae cyanobacterium]
MIDPDVSVLTTSSILDSDANSQTSTLDSSLLNDSSQPVDSAANTGEFYSPDELESEATAIAAEVTVATTTSQPDLTITDGFTAPTSTGVGSYLTFDYTVNNEGDAAASYNYTKFYLSEDTTLDSEDTLFGYDYVAYLKAGSSRTESASVYLSSYEASGLSGDYYIIAEADGYEYRSESDETNNVGVSSNTVTISQADLTITDGFTTPTSTGVGSYLSFDYTVNNESDVTASYSYTKFYLSEDTTLDDGDTYFGYDYVSSVAGNSSSTESASVYLSSYYTSDLSGDYYIIAEADGWDYVGESDEDNNVAVSSNTVTISQPDLTITDGFTTSTSGNYLSFDYTLNNEGGATASYSYTKFYLSEDTTLDDGDTYFGYDYVSSVAGNSSSTESASVYLSSYYTSDLSGDYYIIAEADGWDYVGESDEDNNVGVSSNTITFSQPDLTITDGFTAPTSTGANSYLSFDYTVNNEGGAAANYIYTKFYLSEDTTLDDGDTYFGYDYVYSLAGNTSSTESASVYLSSYEASGLSGDYYIIAEADGWDYVSESDEDNNVGVSSNTITFSQPD